jgi:tetratricopeptide (TPR) repeat protein
LFVFTETEEERLDFYRKNSERYPRSDVPRRLPLEFLNNEEKFKELIDKYMRRALHKGVPPLFKEIKHLYKNERKLKIIEQLVLGYVESLLAHSKFNQNDATDQELESPTTLLWSYYYLAQHFDYLNETTKALEFINKAIQHTPTLVELYMVKGRIYKHCGDFYEAVKWLDEAQSLDTADRYINYKCSKYMLRANMIKEAQDIAAKFTRVSHL